jgi:pantoate--beta-alanine ligase
VRAWSDEKRAEGNRIAFVPTMGAFHEGHLSLIREGRRLADKVAVSIYVNPKQFGPGEDLAKYPRDVEGDLSLARKAGANAVFLPSDAAMYPEGFRTYVDVEGLSEILCGASRPTHFRGVTTVCAKLFAIVNPHVVVMGEKDYQQLIILRTMVRDMDLPVEIASMPIVREADGLAMSSRNQYLSPEEREAALSLKRSLDVAKEMTAGGERDASKLKKAARDTIESAGLPKIDYVEVVHPETLSAATELPARLLLAAHVGSTRLIDNCGLPE